MSVMLLHGARESPTRTQLREPATTPRPELGTKALSSEGRPPIQSLRRRSGQAFPRTPTFLLPPCGGGLRGGGHEGKELRAAPHRPHEAGAVDEADEHDAMGEIHAPRAVRGFVPLPPLRGRIEVG
jgi:hypothetical protein